MKKSNPCPTASNPHTSNALDVKLSYFFFTFGMSRAYLSTNLISALASLDMYDLTHLGFTISVCSNAHTSYQPLTKKLTAKVKVPGRSLGLLTDFSSFRRNALAVS
jgi:hypothetical protein